MDFICSNKEWIFSGIGVFILSGLIFLVKRVLSKQKPKHNINIKNKDQKFNNILSRAIAEISSSTGVDVKDIGMHIWLINKLPEINKEVLQRVGRVRMSDATPSKTYHWAKGQGVVGQCWKKQTDISLDLTDQQYNISSEEDWNNRLPDFRMGEEL